MFSAFINCFKIPELKRRILFTLGIVALARMGANIPCPGVDPTPLTQFLADAQKGTGGGLFGLADMFTGGGLQKCAVFALGIMPYISASIIMQLLTAVIPAFEKLRQEGESGRAKIIQYGRYMTILICIVQSFALAVAFERPSRLIPNLPETIQLVANPGFSFRLMTVITITSGSLLLMWMGEQITERGIGNGASIIITIGIIDRLPNALMDGLRFLLISDLDWPIRIIVGLMFIAMAVVVTMFIVAITQAQRKIPVQYAQRMVGRKVLGGGQTFMPLRINYSGVMPIIFGSAILQLPQLASMSQWTPLVRMARAFQEDGMIYAICYGLMIVFFSYFWVMTQFNPLQIADDLKKYGGYVPGIRPGRPTAEYLDHVMTRITLAGAIFLVVIALIPTFLYRQFHVGYGIAQFFGGTSLLIAVGVMLDTMRQVESHLVMRHYDGFLRKGRLRGRR
jgi:preprotein translocase subunit SecY